MNKETLDKYVSDGWLISNRHPHLPLTIYNYSQATQYEGKWDDITISCRGLILDDNGNVIARPFKKFFNIEEEKHVPTEDFKVYDKMDGSLGILFWYNNDWHLATRGSFTSDQAIKGKEILSKYDLRWLSPEFTYLFEIIYPENRIVVNYGNDEKLVMLGEVHTETGTEDTDFSEYENFGFDVVKMYDAVQDFDELKALNWNNKEGFVIKFTNGYRCKIKFEDYVTLHRIITNVSSYDIWENLKSFGKVDGALLTRVPDEFYEWVRGMEGTLKDEYEKIEKEYKWIFNKITQQLKGDYIPNNRKTFAKLTKDFKYPGILFSMYDGKDYSQHIWKLIKPEYEKPFANS